MTHSPLPYTANGESLLDARGNVIATFLDYRDAEACAEAVADVPSLKETVESLEDRVEALRDELSFAQTTADKARDKIDEAVQFIRAMRGSLANDFATLDETIGELAELKESLE